LGYNPKGAICFSPFPNFPYLWSSNNTIAIDLSIIIVNYNVRHFLEQCLHSVQQAIRGMEAEIIVVDNNSQDGSQAMLRDKFGDSLILIENKDNPGFSKANNQGLAIAKGRWVLLLNPDTVVAEDTFRRCLDFSDKTPDCGALGIYMLDGEGHFLPESKRALPTPWVSFYKIFGLSALFPQSKRFGQYHLTYLDKDEDHQIEILSGAFMWMRKSLLDEIGYLDETFFMYGEDIDLSYRVMLGGMKNYYLAKPKIIHYKGESTKKGSLNYVKVFYQAMIIFARKHFGGARKRFFIAAINLAVYFRAILALGYRLIQTYGFAILEALLIYGMMFGIKAYWEHYIKYIDGGKYPTEFPLYYMPAYTLVFVFLLWVMGAYKKPFRIRPLIIAPFIGFLSIATGTYMFTFIKNFSRAIVGLSAVFTTLLTIATRGLINRREKGSFFFTEESKKRVLLIGSEKGIARLAQLIRAELPYPVEVVGGISSPDPSESKAGQVEILGKWEELQALISIYGIQELIFDAASLSTQAIFEKMIALRHQGGSYKILPPGCDFIVGPQEILHRGASHPDSWAINRPGAKRAKRSFELFASLLMILAFPLTFWAYRRPLKAISLWAKVFVSRRSMVGYAGGPYPDLPPLKPGILDISHRSGEKMTLSATEKMDRYYAKSYSWQLDLEIFVRAWSKIC